MDIVSILHELEDRAHKLNPDSEEYAAVQREYARCMTEAWKVPLTAQDAARHDARRPRSPKFGGMTLPAPGTQAWATLARKAGVQPSLIAEAPARATLVRMAEQPVCRCRRCKRYGLLHVIVTAYACFNQPPYDTHLDRALEHLTAIVRKARELGFYPSDAASEKRAA